MPDLSTTTSRPPGVKPASDPGEGVEDAAHAFLTAGRALMGIALRSVAAAPVPLTVPQHRMLVLVTGDRGRRIGELAEDLGVNQSNASRLVDRLAQLDLARRTPDPEDGRASVIEATAAGLRVLAAVNDHRMRELRTIVGTMPRATRTLAVHVLDDFADAAHETSS